MVLSILITFFRNDFHVNDALNIIITIRPVLGSVHNEHSQMIMLDYRMLTCVTLQALDAL